MNLSGQTDMSMIWKKKLKDRPEPAPGDQEVGPQPPTANALHAGSSAPRQLADLKAWNKTTASRAQ